MNKKLISALLAAATAASVASCGFETSEFKPTKEDKKAVMNVTADVGSETVQYQEYRYFFLSNKNDLYGADAEMTEEQTAKVKSLTENNIRKFHTVNFVAKKHGVELSESERKTVEGYTESFRTENALEDDEYKLLLEQYFTTDYFFEKLYENALLSTTLMKSLTEMGVLKASEADVRTALDNDEILCAKEIFVSYNTEETREFAKLRADDVFRQLTEGAAFEDMMREYSDYSAEALSPEHGYYTMEYDALDVVWEALNDLAEGEYSVVLESEYGFHIVYRAEKEQSFIDDNIQTICDAWANAKYSEYLYGYMDTLTLDYTEYGESLNGTIS